MNTKELLQQAIELLEAGNNVEASDAVAKAAEADVDNTFEALADKLYSDLLIEKEEIANKFKNLYSKHLELETDNTPEEKETVVINNNNEKKGPSAVKWIVIILIVILVMYFIGQVLSIDTLSV